MIPPPPIDTNHYAIEYTQGPVFASNRVVGLGGASTAIAEAVEGMYSTPAAPAVREYDSLKWFDMSLDAGLTFPGSYGSTDYENRGKLGISSGEKTYDDFLRVGFGFVFQFGPVGIGATDDIIVTDVVQPKGKAQGLALNINTLRTAASFALFGGQVMLGAGLRAVNFTLDATTVDGDSTKTGAELFSVDALGPEFGVVVKPDWSRWRAAVTFRTAASSSVSHVSGSITSAGVTSVNGLITPSHLQLPAEVEAGVAVQLGPRELNPPFIDIKEQKREIDRTVGRREVARVAEKNRALDGAAPEDREALALAWDDRNNLADWGDHEWASGEKRRLDELPEMRRTAERRKLLLLASVVGSAPTDNSVAISGFIDQQHLRVGRSVTVSPHAGAEFEPIYNRMTAQVGSYLEPSRYAGVGPRLHGTSGFSVRLFEWTVFGLWPEHTSWQFNVSLDVSTRDYYDYGFAIGTWD